MELKHNQKSSHQWLAPRLRGGRRCPPDHLSPSTTVKKEQGHLLPSAGPGRRHVGAPSPKDQRQLGRSIPSLRALRGLAGRSRRPRHKKPKRSPQPQRRLSSFQRELLPSPPRPCPPSERFKAESPLVTLGSSPTSSTRPGKLKVSAAVDDCVSPRHVGRERLNG